MRYLSLMVVFFTLTAAVIPVCSVANDGGTHESAYDALVHEGSRTTDIELFFYLYQNLLSQHNGSVCLFFPTCSNFFRRSVIHYGVVPAVLMTIDRIFFRENESSLTLYPRLKDNRYYDPVFHNYIFDRRAYYIESESGSEL